MKELIIAIGVILLSQVIFMISPTWGGVVTHAITITAICAWQHFSYKQFKGEIVIKRSQLIPGGKFVVEGLVNGKVLFANYMDDCNDENQLYLIEAVENSLYHRELTTLSGRELDKVYLDLSPARGRYPIREVIDDSIL